MHPETDAAAETAAWERDTVSAPCLQIAMKRVIDERLSSGWTLLWQESRMTLGRRIELVFVRPVRDSG